MAFTRIAAALSKRHDIGFFSAADRFLKTRSPGDQVIGLVAIGIAALGAFAAYYGAYLTLTVAVPARGGELTEGVVGSPRFVNPLLALSDADRDLVELTYAGLMTIGEDGTLVPELAESYSVSEDGREYLFTLREGIVFHDGSPVTAEDVAYTVRMAQDPLLKSPRRASWEGVGVDALDARTVRFTLKEPYAPFLENTTLGILPMKVWKEVSPEEFPFTTFTTEPVGAGPFKLASVSRDSSGILKTYRLESFDRYALGQPYLTRITLEFFPKEDALVKALGSGDVSSAHSIAPDRVDRELAVIRGPYARIFGIFANQTRGPVLKELAVRQALSVLTDRRAIVASVLGGYGRPIDGPLPSAIDESPALSAEERGAEARKILEKGGWSFDEEAKVYTKGKGDARQELRLTMKTANTEELARAAGVVKAAWEAAGIPTAVELYEASDLQQGVIRPREYDLLFFGLVVGREPDLFAFWHSSQREDPGLNIALYANVTADGYLAKARESSERSDREAALEKFSAELAKETPAVFTHAPDFVYLVPKSLKGVPEILITTPSDRFATAHLWHRESERIWPVFTDYSPEESP